jgi:hypothetical protein
MAAGLALDDCGYTSQGKREPLRELLISRERERGLGSTEAEQDQEIALEALEAEAGGPVVPAEPEEGSVEAIRRDAQLAVGELEQARRRLAPQALTDLDVRAEVELIEGQIAQARATAQLADDAEAQTAQLAAEEVKQAESERCAAHDAEARKLEPAISKQLAVVDQALAGAVVPEVVKLAEMMSARHNHLVAGGLDSFSARGVAFDPGSVESAIRYAFEGTSLGLFRGASGRNHPLVPEVKS